LDPGSSPGSHLFEPRLARLRLGVFEPMDTINDESRIHHQNECKKILEQTSNQSNFDSNDLIGNIRSGKFYVYGNERRVYFPKYPANYLRYYVI
jgi:hypothetical protein